MSFLGICQDLLDGNDLPGTDIEIFQDLGIQMIDDGKGAAVLPKEVDEVPLAEDADNIVCAFFGYEDAVGTAGEELNGRRQFRGLRESD